MFFEPAMRAAMGTINANGKRVSYLRNNGQDEYWVTRNEGRVSIIEASVIVLARLSTTSTWDTLAELLGGLHVSRYKMLFGEVIQAVHDHWFNRLTDVRRYEAHMNDWRAVIEDNTDASPRLVGFLDGTWLDVPRPMGDDALQRSLYNRYHRGHGLKFQSLVAPNGLILDLYGPVAGRHADSTMLARSGLEAKLHTISGNLGYTIVVYADSAYGASEHVMRGLKRNMMHTDDERAYSAMMSGVRVAVEWAFGQIRQDFPFLKLDTNAKVFLSPVAMIWQVGALLSNCKACLAGGNIVSDTLGGRPFSLAEYLS